MRAFTWSSAFHVSNTLKKGVSTCNMEVGIDDWKTWDAHLQPRRVPARMVGRSRRYFKVRWSWLPGRPQNGIPEASGLWAPNNCRVR